MAETKADEKERLPGEGLADLARRRRGLKAGEESQAAEAKERYGSTAGKGLGAMEKSSGGEPKQDSGESLSAYAARLRQWRESNDPQTRARKKALGGS